MSYLSERDKLSYLVIITYGVVGYFIPKAVGANWFFSVITLVLIVVVGFYIAKWLYKKPNNFRLVFGVLIPIIALLIVLFGARSKGIENKLLGLWSTNDQDDVQIVMSFVSADSVYMSMSPYYEEVGYKYKLEDNYLNLQRKDEDLRWYLSEVSLKQFVLRKGKDSLIFYNEK